MFLDGQKSSLKPCLAKLLVLCGFSLFAPTAISRPLTTVTMAWKDLPSHLDPRYGSGKYFSHLESLVHCSLTQFSAEGEIRPQLLEKWDWSENNVLRLTLKKNISFSNGSPVTAKTVQATIEFLMKNPKLPRAEIVKKLKKLTVLDDYNLRLEFTSFDPWIMNGLSFGLLPEGYAASSGVLGKNPKNIVGCGPYLITEWKRDEILLIKNSHYRLSDPPVIDHIRIKKIISDEEIVRQIVSGEIDLTQEITNPDILDKLAKKPAGFKIFRKTGFNLVYLGFNFKDKLVQDIRLRKAISLAIDRDKITKYLLKDYGDLARAIFPPNHPFYAPGLGLPVVDKNLARNVLEQIPQFAVSGKEQHVRPKLTMITGVNLRDITIAKALAAELKPLGLSLEIVPFPKAQFNKKICVFPYQLRIDAIDNLEQPVNLRKKLLSETCLVSDGDLGRGPIFQFRSVFEGLNGQKSPEAFKTGLSKVEGFILENFLILPLWHEQITAIVGKHFKDFVIYPNGSYFSGGWLGKE